MPDGMSPRGSLLSPEVLAPARLCSPGHQHLSTSSASLKLSLPLPVSDGYRQGLWHSRIILPEPQTFRAFAAGLSGIAAFNFRREPGACTSQFLPHQQWPSGRSVKPLALQLTCNQLPAGHVFRRLVRSLSLRPFRLRAPLDWSDLSLATWPPGALTPGLPAARFPSHLPGMTTAPHWDLRRRDLHPLVKQLASLRQIRTCAH